MRATPWRAKRQERRPGFLLFCPRCGRRRGSLGCGAPQPCLSYCVTSSVEVHNSVRRPKASVQSDVFLGWQEDTSLERRTTWRISAKEESSPLARTCTSRLPIAVASTGPATTDRWQASAVNWFRISLLEPPPTWCQIQYQ